MTEFKYLLDSAWALANAFPKESKGDSSEPLQLSPVWQGEFLMKIVKRSVELILDRQVSGSI